jgi:WD40 repeat protein
VNVPKPQFELSRVYDDGNSDPPQIVPLAQLPWDVQADRTGFLAAGLIAASALALAGCGSRSRKAVRPPEVVHRTPPPTACVASGLRTATASIAFTPNGKLLVSGGDDATVKLWKWPGGAHVKTLFGHKGDVNAVAVDHRGKLLASGSDDNRIKLWRLPSGTLLRTLRGHRSVVTCLAISPDSSLLASGAADGTIRLWTLPDGRLAEILHSGSPWVHSVAISPDGSLLASSDSDHSVKLWSLPDGSGLATLNGHTDQVRSVAISPNGRLLASGGYDKTVRLWRLPGGEAVATLRGHRREVEAVAFSPDGSRLASGGREGSVDLWDVATRFLRMKLYGGAEHPHVKALAFGRRGDFAVASNVGIQLWHLPEGGFADCLQPIAEQPKRHQRRRARPVQPPSSVPVQPSPGPPSGGSYCTCNTVCTCIPVGY